MRCNRISIAPPNVRRLSRRAGIAIGPILFVLAILGILAAVLSVGSTDFSVASIADRLTADIPAQANLIRAKILECHLLYGTNNNFDSYPQTSDTVNGALVSSLSCTGDNNGSGSNLWTGLRAAFLPPPSTGMNAWYYVNTNGVGQGGTAIGGRCIWTTPSVSNPSSNKGYVTGLTKAASKFTNSTSNDGASTVNYNPASTSQRFVVWITLPTGTPAANCTP